MLKILFKIYCRTKDIRDLLTAVFSQMSGEQRTKFNMHLDRKPKENHSVQPYNYSFMWKSINAHVINVNSMALRKRPQSIGFELKKGKLWAHSCLTIMRPWYLIKKRFGFPPSNFCFERERESKGTVEVSFCHYPWCGIFFATALCSHFTYMWSSNTAVASLLIR